MSTARVVLSCFAVTASAIWLLLGLQIARHRGRITRLHLLPDGEPPGGWPPVALVFAARDEAATVERASRSLLAQDYPALRVIAVDDRSSDGTGAILDALAIEDSRLSVVHICDLPPGWLGKTNALHQAALRTDAPWVLFTDADVLHEPRTLRRAIGHALRTDADHVVATPANLTETFGERVFLTQFLAAFLFTSSAWAVEDPDRRKHLGIGAFNLVRSDAFRAIGGFRNLALSVDDDMRLGEALKSAGYQPRVVDGTGGVAVRWQVGVRGHVRGLEKNFFAALEFNLAIAVAAAVAVLWGGVAPWLGLAFGPAWVRIVSGLAIVAIAAVIEWMGRPSGVRWWHGLLMPLSALLLGVTLARSTWFTLRRGGVLWRDTLYPLEALRAHVRARKGWLRSLWRETH